MDLSINSDFENRCLEIVKDKIMALSEGVDGKIFLFGSRVRGDFRRGSDIDVGFYNMGKSSFQKLKIQLGLYLEESIVPYHVDLVNFNLVNPEFSKIALKEIEVWKKG